MPRDAFRLRILGRALRAARQRARLTQEEVAHAAGISCQFYGRCERAFAWPSIGTLRRLCAVLHVPADTLLGLAPDAELPPAPLAADPPPLRRLVRRLRRAPASTLRAVTRILDEMDRARTPPSPTARTPE